jgi:protein-tyrosine phosphatase
VEGLVALLTPDECAELELTEEPQFCSAAGIEFISFPILDRTVPTSIAGVRALVVRFTSLLAANKRIAIHCRSGVGRSGVIWAATMIALGHRADAARAAIAKARGCSVPDTAAQRELGAESHGGLTEPAVLESLLNVR